jgi:hypothetical protein
VSAPGEQFKVAPVFTLYDPALGEGGGLRSVVDADAYLRAVQLLIRYRLDVKRLLKRPAAPVRAPVVLTETDTPVVIKERIGKAEAQLWMWSWGKASYFEDYPEARPLDSLRESR